MFVSLQKDAKQSCDVTIHLVNFTTPGKSNLILDALQISLTLKEWDIPYEELQVDDKIGCGRFGVVHRYVIPFCIDSLFACS